MNWIVIIESLPNFNRWQGFEFHPPHMDILFKKPVDKNKNACGRCFTWLDVFLNKRLYIIIILK